MSAAIGITFTLLALVGAIRVVLAVYRTLRALGRTLRAIPGALKRATTRKLARIGQALASLDSSAPAIARDVGNVSLEDLAKLAMLARKRAARARAT